MAAAGWAASRSTIGNKVKGTAGLRSRRRLPCWPANTGTGTLPFRTILPTLVAQRLYQSLGFVETGEWEDDEMVARY